MIKVGRLAVELALGAALVAFSPGSAHAGPINQGPPPGAILDLSGTPVPGGGNNTFGSYSVSFVATLVNTGISFAFREDPEFITFEDASVVDLTTSSGNLLTNGDFSGGTYTSNGNSLTPVGWTYANPTGTNGEGVVSSGGCAPNGTADCWLDAAVQAYDSISQTISTTIGDTYQISFNVADNSGCGCNFSDLSTNGDDTDYLGNGINVVAYADGGVPAVPEPSTVSLFMAGMAGAFLASRRMRRVQ